MKQYNTWVSTRRSRQFLWNWNDLDFNAVFRQNFKFSSTTLPRYKYEYYSYEYQHLRLGVVFSVGCVSYLCWAVFAWIAPSVYV